MTYRVHFHNRKINETLSGKSECPDQSPMVLLFWLLIHMNERYFLCKCPNKLFWRTTLPKPRNGHHVHVPYHAAMYGKGIAVWSCNISHGGIEICVHGGVVYFHG